MSDTDIDLYLQSRMTLDPSHPDWHPPLDPRGHSKERCTYCDLRASIAASMLPKDPPGLNRFGPQHLMDEAMRDHTIGPAVDVASSEPIFDLEACICDEPCDCRLPPLNHDPCDCPGKMAALTEQVRQNDLRRLREQLLEKGPLKVTPDEPYVEPTPRAHPFTTLIGTLCRFCDTPFTAGNLYGAVVLGNGENPLGCDECVRKMNEAEADATALDNRDRNGY